MASLTDGNRRRARLAFRVGWYINLVILLIALLGALYFYTDSEAGAQADTDRDITMAAGLLVVACVLLMGASLTHLKAHAEEEHHELKEAIEEVSRRIEEIKRARGK